MVHAGWRGAAAGILERTVTVMGERFGTAPDALALHLGPSICGTCYEVGPEVHEALGEPVPTEPTPVDLPANLARRARSLGIPEAEITRSTCCTLCGPADLFSHRGGDAGRQIGFLGIR
jgi:copper oxidase (laccase) domain-containing protein